MSKAHNANGTTTRVKSKDFKVSFAVSGVVYQYIHITNKAWQDREKLQQALNDGTVLTTVQDDGSVDITENGECIGRVEEGMTGKSDLVYEDFNVIEVE